MDSAQWTQEIGMGKSMAEIASSAPRPGAAAAAAMERKVRPSKDQAINCPRCQSTNTKFCYYNNYSLTQPRYFCKTCRRYWTQGGTLRNIPVGGGSRKNKKSSTSSSSTSSPSLSMATSHKHIPDLNPPACNFSENPRNSHLDQGQDLNLGLIPPPQDNPIFGLNSFMPAAMAAPGNSQANLLLGSSGFPFNQESKPASALAYFSFDGIDAGRLYGNPDASQGINLVFPFGAAKRQPSTGNQADDHDQLHGGNKRQDQASSNGYWSGMLGGGSW